jgi:hypothetical protein
LIRKERRDGDKGKNKRARLEKRVNEWEIVAMAAGTVLEARTAPQTYF